MIGLNAAKPYGSGIFVTNKLILGVLMQRIRKMIQIGCFTLILAFGGIHISDTDVFAGPLVCEEGEVAFTGVYYPISNTCSFDPFAAACADCMGG